MNDCGVEDPSFGHQLARGSLPVMTQSRESFVQKRLGPIPRYGTIFKSQRRSLWDLQYPSYRRSTPPIILVSAGSLHRILHQRLLHSSNHSSAVNARDLSIKWWKRARPT